MGAPGGRGRQGEHLDTPAGDCIPLSCRPQGSQMPPASSDVLYQRPVGMQLTPPLMEHYLPRSMDPSMPVIVNTRSLKEGDGGDDGHSVADGEMYRYSEEEDSEGEDKSDGELVVLTD